MKTRRFIMVSAVMLTVLLAMASEGSADDFDGVMLSGRQSLDQGDYAQAERDFRQAVKLRPKSTEALLALGITLSKRKSDEAFSILNRALLLDPENPRTNLELGQLYEKRGISAEALEYLETVQEFAPGSPEARRAEEIIKEIQRKEIARPWELEASLGGEYDTNVILLASDVEPPAEIDDEEDYRAVFSLKGEYSFLDDAQRRALAGYSFYQSLHNDLDDYDVQSHTVQLKGLYFLRPMTLDVRYEFNATTLGGDDFGRSHSISPSLILPQREGMYTVFTYRLNHTDYDDGDVFPVNSDKTGYYHLVGIVQALPLDANLKARLGYSYDFSETKEDYRDYRGHKIFAYLDLTLPYRMGARLYGEYYRRDFSGPSPQREEDKYTASVSLKAELMKRMSLTLSQAYITNKADPEPYDYTRAITALFLTARF